MKQQCVKSFRWAKEHYAIILSLVTILLTVCGFAIVHFATIEFVEAKHDGVTSQQRIDRQYNKEQFDGINKKLDTSDGDIKEILRFLRQQ